MPIRAAAGRSPPPGQTVHRPADVHDRVDELEVQSAVARWVRNALSDGKLKKAAEAVEVGVNARNFAERSRVHSASEASAAQTPAERFSARAARLVRKGIKASEVVFIDAEGDDPGFGPPWPDSIA